MKAMVLLEPNLNSDNHQFCHILFIRIKSLGAVHIQGGEHINTGAILEAACDRP